MESSFNPPVFIRGQELYLHAIESNTPCDVSIKRNSWADSKRYDWGIFRQDDDQHLGYIAIHTVFWDSKSCELGYYIHEQFRNSGLMKNAISILLNALFSSGMNRVTAMPRLDNLPSIKVLKNCNFTHEGTMRDYFFEEGQFCNYEVYSIITRDLQNS